MAKNQVAPFSGHGVYWITVTTTTTLPPPLLPPAHWCLQWILNMTVGNDDVCCMAEQPLLSSTVKSQHFARFTHLARMDREADANHSLSSHSVPEMTALHLAKNITDFYRAVCNSHAVEHWECCPSVRPSVRLSVKRVNCDKTEEKSVQIFIPYERSFSLVFWEEEWLVGGDSFYLNFGSTSPHWSEIADFQPIFARSASAVTPSEKSLI